MGSELTPGCTSVPQATSLFATAGAAYALRWAAARCAAAACWARRRLRALGGPPDRPRSRTYLLHEISLRRLTMDVGITCNTKLISLRVGRKLSGRVRRAGAGLAVRAGAAWRGRPASAEGLGAAEVGEWIRAPSTISWAPDLRAAPTRPGLALTCHTCGRQRVQHHLGARLAAGAEWSDVRCADARSGATGHGN